MAAYFHRETNKEMSTSIPEAVNAPPVANTNNLLPETAELHTGPISSARPNGAIEVSLAEDGEHEQLGKVLGEQEGIQEGIQGAGQEDARDSAQNGELETKEEGAQEDARGVAQQDKQIAEHKESGQQGESQGEQHSEQHIERQGKQVERHSERRVEQHVERQGEQVEQQDEQQNEQDSEMGDVRKSYSLEGGTPVPVMGEEGDLAFPASLPEPEALKPREPTTVPPKAVKVAAVTKTFTSRLPGWTRTNAFVARLNRYMPLFGSLQGTFLLTVPTYSLMSTSSGTDRALMTTSYSLMALTAQLDRLSDYRALAYSQKAATDPLRFFDYLILARQQENSRLFALSTHLKHLTSLISDVRIFMRLWGLFGIYEWLVSTLREPPKDRTLRRIAYAQISANMLYQIFENLAYLGQHKVLPIRKDKQNSYWLWSSRFWMVHVVLEFWRLKREWELGLKGKVKDQKADIEKDPKWYNVMNVLKSEGRSSVWLKQLWSNMAYAPLTVRPQSVMRIKSKC